MQHFKWRTVGEVVGMMVRARVWLYLLIGCSLFTEYGVASAEHRVSGLVTDVDGQALAGVMLTFAWGEPERSVSVYSQRDGHYQTPILPDAAPYQLRTRRLGWQSQRLLVDKLEQNIQLERERDPAVVAAQLPANRWFSLVLEQVDNPAHREQLLATCVGCHQQGNLATRRIRMPADWSRVLKLMADLGGGVDPELAKRIPFLFNSSYDSGYAIPRLTANIGKADFSPVPSAEVLNSVVDEWVLAEPDSMLHDLAVHEDGRIYAVDWTRDTLYRIDPEVDGGDLAAFAIPTGDLPVGGLLGDASPLPPNAKAKVAPHSLQMDPAGDIWITLSLSNQLARFNPSTEKWTLYPMQEGVYPHTLRFDQRGRLWYTIAFSDHVGFLNPVSGVHRQIPLTKLAGAKVTAAVPVPYGIDIAPNGNVWFSQLKGNRIGRIDPETFTVELIDTPFTAPRRLRIDAAGDLWIPGFSSGLIARYNPRAKSFTTWELPTAFDTPYAVNVEQATGRVWICGSNSDSLLRFDPATETFAVFPLPTASTYTREIDFDKQGRIWTSNSNFPATHIAGGKPRLIRLDVNEGSRADNGPH